MKLIRPINPEVWRKARIVLWLIAIGVTIWSIVILYYGAPPHLIWHWRAA